MSASNILSGDHCIGIVKFSIIAVSTMIMVHCYELLHTTIPRIIIKRKKFNSSASKRLIIILMQWEPQYCTIMLLGKVQVNLISKPYEPILLSLAMAGNKS